MSSYTGGGGGGAALSDVTPKAAGIVGVAGSGTEAARDDHEHVGPVKPYCARTAGTQDAVYVLPGWTTSSNLTNAPISANEQYSCPIYISRRWRFTGIKCKVTTLQAASLARMGIYAGKDSNGGVAPGALVLDAGTVSCTTTGEQEISIDVTLEAGWYFLTIICDVASVSFEGFGSATDGAPVMGRPPSGTPYTKPVEVTTFKAGQTGVVAGGLADPSPDVGGYYSPAGKAGYVRLKTRSGL